MTFESCVVCFEIPCVCRPQTDGLEDSRKKWEEEKDISSFSGTVSRQLVASVSVAGEKLTDTTKEIFAHKLQEKLEKELLKAWEAESCDPIEASMPKVWKDANTPCANYFAQCENVTIREPKEVEQGSAITMLCDYCKIKYGQCSCP